MPEEEEPKKGYDVALIRLQDSKSELCTDDLDDEERKVLAEVSKKGYYHARPKTEEAPPPQRTENPEDARFRPRKVGKGLHPTRGPCYGTLAHGQALQWSAPPTTRKRTTFDKYQQKWDKFDKKEPVVKEVAAKAETPPAQRDGGLSGLWSRCCRRKR
eukprot:UN3952